MKITTTRLVAPSVALTLVLAAGMASGQSGELFPAAFNLSLLNGTNGFNINLIEEFSGGSGRVSSAGDVNGDGIDDLIISAGFGGPGGESRESYVVFGGSTLGSAGAIELSTLNGTNGFKINPVDKKTPVFGSVSVSSAGDVNGDGIDDLIIGMSGADLYGRGASYVVFGGETVGSTGVIELSSLSGTNGFVLNGSNDFDNAGYSVSSAGDVNGDGIDDLFIGAPGGDSNDPYGTSRVGASYVVFGGETVGSTGVIELSSLNGTNGFVLNGINDFDNTGYSVSSAGDVNGDGIDDLIIGGGTVFPGSNGPNASYVVFGGATVGSTGVIELSSLNGSNGFVLNGIDTYDGSGHSVSSAGDVNGDGIDDLLIGAPGGDSNGAYDAGESYVVFGGATVGSIGVIELSSLNGSNGFVLSGINDFDNCGFSVSSAGDVNGDGIDDLLIGAPGGDSNGAYDAGESYVVFGGATVGSVGVIELSSLNGSNGFVLSGSFSMGSSGRSVSSAGDVNGDGIEDVIIAGSSGFSPDPYSSNTKGHVVFGRLIPQKWTRSGGGAFEIGSNWFTGLSPTGGPVTIEPEFGGNVTLSQPVDLLLSSLALGSERGVTKLDIGPFSLLGINEPFGLPASAAIDGSGILVADAGIMNSGILGGDGLFVFAGAGVTNNGEIASQQLLIVADVTNNELIDLDGNSAGSVGRAVLDVNGILSNETTGVVQMRRAVTELSVSSGLSNAGQVSVAFSVADIIGDVLNLGTPDGMGGFTPLGSIAISGSSSALLTDDLTNQSTVVLTSDSELIILGGLAGNGISGPGGPGTAGMVFVEDGISPGFSPGIARFDGDLMLGLTGTTLFEIAGTTAGAGGHDQIVVAGMFGVGGSASIELVNGFVPSAGDTFQLLEFGEINGGFSSLTIDPELLALNVDTSNLLIDGTISIPVACLADLTDDGVLNFFDVSVFLQGFGNQDPVADFTGDGVWNFFDVSAFLQAFSAGCP
jgi:FG-GAP repeat